MNRLQLKIGGFSTLLLLSLISLSPAVFAADSEVKRLSEPVAVTETHEMFGAMLPEEGAPLSLGELVENNDRYQDEEVLLATRIAQVCQKKGCFFVAQEGANTARVTF